MSGKEFGFGTPGFDRIEWINLNVLRIYFEQDHNMDGFGIMHSFDENDDFDAAMYLCAAPRFEGPKDYPIVEEIKSTSLSYPNRKFKLVAFEGEFSNCGESVQFNYLTEVLGAATFTIPESIAPRPNFDDMETLERTTLPIHTD